jgi:hypothetical protein
MSAIGGVTSTASQYQTDTESPWEHHGKGSGTAHGARRSGDLSGAQKVFVTSQQNRQNSSQTAGAGGASGRNGQTSAAFQALQSAVNSGDSPKGEETEQAQEGSASGAAPAEVSALSGSTAQPGGHLLDALA